MSKYEKKDDMIVLMLDVLNEAGDIEHRNYFLAMAKRLGVQMDYQRYGSVEE